ncbi:hypothetical protein [Gordonia polyisoprenivorans]|uniref:hypothetical protein n=1 Tax=Gordonia polyisoprenivorans TaxID=84595 RepID=UPI001AD675EC|nr:hypothetical protein [Gordonia polyisoprenivorans]QTI68590.1 hypothetical protein J6U32_24500 [Gordonia polyisoprenivorans]
MSTESPMSTHRIRVAIIALAVVVFAAVPACTVSGDPVADPSAASISTTTTDPDATTDSPDPDDSTAPDATEPDSTQPDSTQPDSSTEAPISDVPAPPNSTTMTCSQFVTLDRSTQAAVLRANGATADNTRLGVVIDIYTTVCPGYPDALIADLVAGRLPN